MSDTLTAFSDHFSGHADMYARYRPGYPDALLDWLAEAAPGRERAWDCATGNGQAAVALAGRFAEVVATDASAEQVGNAFLHARVEYRVSPAEASGLEAESVDLVTVAQAVHWFDVPAFFAEARRVLRPSGLLAVWAYGVFALSPEVDRVVHHLDHDVVGPYWPPERKAIKERYCGYTLPFLPVDAPPFEMEKRWTADDALGYLRTWSAVQRYARANGADPVEGIADELRRAWGEGVREFRWPLILLVGRKEPTGEEP